MTPEKTPKSKVIATYFPDSENDETAEKLRDMQAQIDALSERVSTLEKRADVLEDSDE